MCTRIKLLSVSRSGFCSPNERAAMAFAEVSRTTPALEGTPKPEIMHLRGYVPVDEQSQEQAASLTHRALP